MPSSSHQVGNPAPRIDAAAKVTGQTKYAADLVFPGMLHARVYRSPLAHARIVRIDAAAARKLPGVRAVLTAADLPAGSRDPAVRVDTLLADGEVFFFGQPVVAVAADTAELADLAIERLVVEYEELPAVLDVERAVEPDASPARLADVASDRPNVSNRLRFQRGDAQRALGESDLVVENRFEIAGIHQAYLEPQVAIASYESGRLTIWSPTQGQFQQRADIARTLGLPVSKVRYIVTEVGGGFGGKSPAVIQPLVGALALAAGRPVRLLLTRKEDLTATLPAPRGVIRARVGASSDGTLTAIEARVLFEAGAFPAGPVVGHSMMIASWYRFPHLDVEGLEVRTNKVSGWAYRAPGGPQVAFAIEQLIDELAVKLGRDPIDFRKQNAVKEGDLMPNNRPWPKIGLIESLEALEQTDLVRDCRQSRPGDSADGVRRGWGVAVGGWLGALQPASALVRLNDDGSVTVIVGSSDISGTLTSFAQIVGEELSLPVDRVEAMTADSDSAPYAGSAAGSKTMYTVGTAVLAAARDARAQILSIAAQISGVPLERIRLDEGDAVCEDERIPFARIGALSTGMGGRYKPVMGRGEGNPRVQAPGFCAQAVEIELDSATDSVTLTRAAAVQDVGKAINRLTVEGQIQGGVTQGLGIGLTEALLYDKAGRPTTTSFLDYRLLTALDVPNIETGIVEVPSPEGPYGARIVGEPSIVAGAAAVANAVRNATGHRVTGAPVTPERIWSAMRE